ncbi:response regulator [Candidatus Nitrosotalea bavarica]|uniref:response regulator n=1 Tax=Candidatus Nitrosotalea bavarica TaxID=1903277 RepID=UPI000C700F1E|nr:response regulator [Candidatus Nitrosotalea bavarica]
MHNSITIRLPDAMIQSIDDICKKQESTRQEIIRSALSVMLLDEHRISEFNITKHSKTPNISESNEMHTPKQFSLDKVHSKIHAIVIEDDPDMRDVFAEVLQMHNITVIGTGSNGKEAADLYEKLHPDIVFMDIIMPTYDGFHGVDAIRKMDPDAKIIIVTGAVIDSKKNPLSKTTQLVEKPVDMKGIMNAVNKIMMAS